MNAASAIETSPALPRGLFHGNALEFHIVPLGMTPAGSLPPADPAESFLRLADLPLAFSNCRVVWRDGSAVLRQTNTDWQTLRAWAETEGDAAVRMVADRMAAIARPADGFAGLAPGRPAVMGIVNVTPDSFSDGGDHDDPKQAIAHGLSLWKAGADILDIGGESTRPGSDEVPPAEELRRVLPVVRALVEAGAVVSIDTRHAEVMAEAAAAGAAIINDISALESDPRSLEVAAASGAHLVLMHMQGEPKAMQTDPHYDCAPIEVYAYLERRVEAALAAGVARQKISIDPGIGFGKSVAHNLEILRDLALYRGLGLPVLLGVSRKGFIGRLSRGETPKDRVAGSLAVALDGADKGAAILRVHDVAETVQALALWRALRAGPEKMTPRPDSTVIPGRSPVVRLNP